MSILSPEFKYVTEEFINEWKGASSSGFRLADPVPMTRFLYELCWAMVRGDLYFQKCKAVLDSTVFIEEPTNEEMPSVLADTIALLAQDLTISGDYRSRLVKLAKSLVESSLVPHRLLQERCEEEFLWEAELSKMKAHDLKAKEVRVNTRLLYQQTKFNLLREESEGYAKLVTLLCQGGLDLMSDNAPAVTISIIKSLIGHFDLDPNRVFDIVLECFELYPKKTIFYDLIPIFPKSHAAQILGFKFQYYQRMDIDSPVPSSLFRLAALSVQANFIDLESIYAHLLPNDEDAFAQYDGYIAKRIDEANKIGKINLAATGKDLMETDEKQDVTVDLYAALDTENDALSVRAPEISKNQKLGFLIGFLSVHDWYHAQILFERLSHLNPVEHIEICDGLFRVIEKTISNAYKMVCQNYREAPGKSIISESDAMEEDCPLNSVSYFSIDLPRDLFQMLSVAGPYLHRDTELLQKVCRVLRGYYLSSSRESESKELKKCKEARVRVEEALSSCLLPSLQLIPANPAIGHQIWEVLSLLPYEVRYRLYGEWEREDEQNPMVLAARQIAKLDTRRILKRLAKENLKQLGRMVAKLAHANPMTVLRTIVHQIEAYRDMITPVVDAFKYLTQLEYDILEYVVIERLAQGGRDKLKEDGLNLSDWLQSLASFWGHLCKKYPSMELRGLFQYLVNQLKKGSGIELVLLEELIQQMANVHYTENMTEEQLDALSGSETLKYQATLFGSTRNNKVLSKSTNRLRDSLLPKEEPKPAIPLLLLIAQYRSMIIINADAPYIKMVSEQFDRCHGMLLQYVDFLSSSVTPSSAYAELIPPLEDLVHTYHLEPEVAFLIYRPVMRLFKSSRGEETYWPLDVNVSDDQPSDTSESDFTLHLNSSHNPTRWSDLLNTVRSMLPPKSWNSLSPDLYTAFWGLSLYDLYVPKNRYDAEIHKQHSALKNLEELSDTSSLAISKRKKDKERIQELLDKLNYEYRKHEKHVESVRSRLAREKDKWLSSCPDTLKTNIEFLQRCVFPRCVFSMSDAVYCAVFVQAMHSLGTPYFNTVNHIDVLICKMIQPLICCCTEYEAGRLGRFLYETLKMAYHWKSSESIYERECGNMPGFAVYYRYPNSQRVTYGQFVRVHYKWSGRITRLLVQCLESTEYMEIRNALIVLTKISSVFPVIRKSGVNLEKRVAKIKADEREDLKVLATGVAAALSTRKSSWVSEEEFGMGHLDLKPTASTAKAPSGNHVAADRSNVASKDQTARAKSTNGAASLPVIVSRGLEESAKISSDENAPTKPTPKPSVETETRAVQKNRSTQNSVGKTPKQELTKEESKSGKLPEGGPDPIGSNKSPALTVNGGSVLPPSSKGSNLLKTEQVQKREKERETEGQDRQTRRRKGEMDGLDYDKDRERDRAEERERQRERSTERRERDRSVERERGKEERYHGQSLPPPPPLPPSFVPQSVEGERRRNNSVEREREREDDVGSKRRRDDDFTRDGRSNKRDDRDSVSTKVEEKERGDKGSSSIIQKEEIEANSKRRKVKREQSSSSEPGEYSPVIPPHTHSHSLDSRGERKGGAASQHRSGYTEEPSRTSGHTSKDSTPSKLNRRDADPSHERDWQEEKRQRTEAKRKHRK